MLGAPVRLIRRIRRYFGPFAGRSRGVHALALTAQGRIVLVKLTYAPDWRLPGGGCKSSENPEQAVLRELAEEIGLLRHGAIVQVPASDPDDDGTLFIVSDVEYAPRRTFEIAQVGEFHPRRLPPDVSRLWRGTIERLCP
jgi:8-oxo-dGTP pyrophosphatase MutT (NUDIX family)